MIGAPRILTDSDVRQGIQALAARTLGTASLWTQIASLNNLAPPYLTFDPTAVYGPSVASSALSSAVASGAKQITISVNTQRWQPGYIVAFAQAGATGLKSESVTIESYDGTTMVFESALQNAYLSGATILAFAPLLLGRTTVLMPGQVIYLPIPDDAATFVFTSGAQQSDVYGADLASPLSWAKGDLATVSGPATLVQRMRTVINTPVGSLPQATQWGSRLSQVLGAPSGSVRWATWVRYALMLLPEVQTVTDVQATMVGQGQLVVSAKVWVKGSKAPLLLQNEALTAAAIN